MPCISSQICLIGSHLAKKVISRHEVTIPDLKDDEGVSAFQARLHLVKWDNKRLVPIWGEIGIHDLGLGLISAKANLAVRITEAICICSSHALGLYDLRYAEHVSYSISGYAHISLKCPAKGLCQYACKSLPSSVMMCLQSRLTVALTMAIFTYWLADIEMQT